MNDIIVSTGELPLGLYTSCLVEAQDSDSYWCEHPALSLYDDPNVFYKYNWVLYDSKKGGQLTWPYDSLWEHVSERIPFKHELLRAYVNAHKFGDEDNIHRDEVRIHKGATIIVYLCDEWRPEWGGQTMFFKDKEHGLEIVHSVLPKPMRYVIFDKDIPHCVAPLSRRFNGIRYSCMFKVSEG